MPAVTKLEAARLQAATAIRLYFENRDWISAHSLAFAALEVIDKLCLRGGLPGWVDGILATVKPENRDEFQKRMRAAANFFKHANRRAEGTIEFDDDETLYLLLGVTVGLFRLGDVPSEVTLFEAWIRRVKPQLFVVANMGPNFEVPANFHEWPRGVQKLWGKRWLDVVLVEDVRLKRRRRGVRLPVKLQTSAAATTGQVEKKTD